MHRRSGPQAQTLGACNHERVHALRARTHEHLKPLSKCLDLKVQALKPISTGAWPDDTDAGARVRRRMGGMPVRGDTDRNKKPGRHVWPTAQGQSKIGATFCTRPPRPKQSRAQHILSTAQGQSRIGATFRPWPPRPKQSRAQHFVYSPGPKQNRSHVLPTAPKAKTKQGTTHFVYSPGPKQNRSHVLPTAPKAQTKQGTTYLVYNPGPYHCPRLRAQPPLCAWQASPRQSGSSDTPLPYAPSHPEYYLG